MAVLPTNVPDLTDVTSLVLDELSCEGIAGNVLQVIGLLTQFEDLTKRFEGRAIQELREDVASDWQDFVVSVRDQLTSAWDGALSEFESWISAWERNNIMDGLMQPFGPAQFLDPVNETGFALFDYRSTSAGQFSGGGAKNDVLPGTGCPAGMGFSLDQSFTTSFSTAIQENVAAAGELASFGAHLAQNPAVFMDAAISLASQLNTLISENAQVFESMEQTAIAIEATLRDLVPEDYNNRVDLVEFGRLLDTAIREIRTVEQRFTTGSISTGDARTAVSQATNWICRRDAMQTRFLATDKASALLAMLQTQVNLFDGSVKRVSRLTSNLSGFQTNLVASARFQPTYHNFFTKVRCGLERIASEVATVSTQNSVRFQTKRLEWCSAMTAYRTLLEFNHPENFATKLNAELETLPALTLKDVSVDLNVLRGDIAEQALLVLEAADRFLRVARIKMQQFIDQEILVEALRALGDRIQEYKALSEQMQAELAKLLGMDGSDAARERFDLMFKAASTVQTIAPLVRSLADGELQAMFTMDGLNSRLEDIVFQVLSKARQCCEEVGATDPQSLEGIQQLRVAEAAAVDSRRAADFDAHFGTSTVVSNGSMRLLIDIRALKQRYEQFRRLVDIPCLGTAVPPPKIF